jgi:hypothetical protein
MRIAPTDQGGLAFNETRKWPHSLRPFSCLRHIEEIRVERSFSGCASHKKMAAETAAIS